ncbi:MAG: HDIG domain-containing protein [Candidatus Zixiibacteriota bacterium]|nr:MAG: HDIG domain-containing protein [candidate division Zixibacteria bacterium]
MFSFLIKLKRKIRKLFKVQSESRQRPVPSVRSRTIKVLLLVMASILVGVFYPGKHLYDPLDMPRKGEISLEDIIAPFQIIVYKTERELKDERELVRLSVPYIVDRDIAVTRGVFGNLKRFFDLVDSLGKEIDSPAVEPGPDGEQIVAAQFPWLSETAIRRSLERDDLRQVYRRLEQIYRQEIYKVGVLPDRKAIPEVRGKNVLVRRMERENIYPREKLLDIALSNARLLTALNRLSVRDSIDVEYYYLVGRSFIRPNLKVSMAEYHRRVEEELAAISDVNEIVNTGDIVVRSGARLTERQQRVLQEVAKIKRTQAAQKGLLSIVAPVLVRILLVAAVFAGLYFFLYHFRRDMFNSNPKLLALLLVFALQLFVIYLVDRWELSIYLFPVALLPMMVTILFDAEVGVLSTLVLALLLGIMHRFNFSLVLMTVVVGTVACFASRRVRQRSHFIKIMFSVSVAYAVFILLVENMKMTPNPELFTEMGYGVVNGIVAAFLTIGILPLFESVFGITTDITLLELSDLNHPLLKRLAIEAPGTFQHSLNVGNLSEAGAKAIGGNSLLARVGTYYHDIGKMDIPEYFVENQLSVKSKHESLTPSMSAVILTAHVKKGRALGEEAGLPDNVLNFIEEHHGTMLMSYFYDKALKQGNDSSSRDKFRYPGPKPQTREAAISMLADAVEAASRTLDQPTPAHIDNLIQRIINDRFQSGELEECPLTLRDLAKIKEAFAQILIAAFHRRVVYPTQEKSEEEA